MTYRIIITDEAEKEMDALSPDVHRRVTKRILALEKDPLPVQSKRLTGGLEGYRLRVGDWRVFYRVDHGLREVRISSVQHRREAYR